MVIENLYCKNLFSAVSLNGIIGNNAIQACGVNYPE